MEASILFPEIMSYESNKTIRIAPPISRSKRRRLVKKKKLRLKKESKNEIAPPLKPPSSSCSGVSPDLAFKLSSSSCSGVSPPSVVLSPDLEPVSEGLADLLPLPAACLDESFSGKKQQPPFLDIGRYNLRLRTRM